MKKITLILVAMCLMVALDVSAERQRQGAKGQFTNGLLILIEDIDGDTENVKITILNKQKTKTTYTIKKELLENVKKLDVVRAEKVKKGDNYKRSTELKSIKKHPWLKMDVPEEYKEKK